MKLYFVRHGESEANVLQVISNRGWVHPLTEKGRQQANTLAEKLRGAGITKIFTSPLRRAAETAEILSQSLGVGIEITDALREFDCGIAEGRSDPEAWRMHRELWNDWIVQLGWESRIEGGESFLDMQRRFVPWLERILREEQNNLESLVLIGHGALYYSMLPVVLFNISRQSIAGVDFPNTGYVLAENGLQGLVCLEWCGAKVSAAKFTDA